MGFIYIAGWLGMLVIAILNGAVREKLYGRFMSELTAHQVSTIICIGLFGIYIWIFTGLWRLESWFQALAVGGTWLVMTIAFEFAFGHCVAGHSWHRLFEDYNLLKGRPWVLVLVWTAAAPCVFYRMRP